MTPEEKAERAAEKTRMVEELRAQIAEGLKGSCEALVEQLFAVHDASLRRDAAGPHR